MESTLLEYVVFIAGHRPAWERRPTMTLLARYRTAEDIPAFYIRQQKELSGVVASVGDGDGFRFYHQAFFSCSPPNIHRDDLAGSTIRVRLAGIDAPEIGHDGRQHQPFAEAARDFLRAAVANRQTIIIKLHSIDQYGRVVASAYAQRLWILRRNLSLALVEAGLASVYTAQGAQYGGIREQLLATQSSAQKRKKGIWSGPASKYESPADYKRKLKG